MVGASVRPSFPCFPSPVPGVHPMSRRRLCPLFVVGIHCACSSVSVLKIVKSGCALEVVGTNEGRSSSRSAWVEREARRDARYDSSDARGRDREEEGEGARGGCDIWVVGN